jgi:hypothetical protein
MSSLRGRHAPDERGRRSSADAIALVGALGVVVADEAVKSPLQSCPSGEVATTEDDPPQLLENRALQALDEAVGPRMARFGAPVAETEVAAGDIKRSLELGAAIGEDR